MVVFVQSGCTRTKWFYSGRVVVFGQGGCIRAKWSYSGKNGYIRAKIDIFGQKCFFSGNFGCNRAMWLYSEKVFLFW